MGSICTNNFEKEEGTETVDTYKNSIYLHVNLGNFCSIDLILGNIFHLSRPLQTASFRRTSCDFLNKKYSTLRSTKRLYKRFIKNN